MTVETVKILILIAIFGGLEAAMQLPKLREARRRFAASHASRRDADPDAR